MITDSFDNVSKPLITLDKFYGEQKFFADICLVTFSCRIRDAILASYSCERVAAIETANGEFPIYRFRHEGKEIVFYLSMIGSACASQCVIEANWLTGATKFIMFGSSGSLDKEKTRNKFVIPTEAYRDEGLSYHYAPPTDYIRIRNGGKLKRIFDELKLPCVEGKIWTTDALMRETADQAARRRAEGCIAVEMEVAGVQSVCDFHGFELYDFLVTGDVLLENDYEYSTLTDANHNPDKFRIALEIAKRI